MEKEKNTLKVGSLHSKVRKKRRVCNLKGEHLKRLKREKDTSCMLEVYILKGGQLKS